MMTELKAGDILHCKSNGFLGRAIRKLTKQSVNHSAVVVESLGQIMIADAQKDGFQTRPLQYWLDKYGYEIIIARRVHERTPKQLDKWHREVGLMTGGETPYDFESLILRQPWLILTGRWKNRGDNREGKKMVCSEVVSFLEGIKWYYNMTPGDLLSFTKFTSVRPYEHINFKR